MRKFALLPIVFLTLTVISCKDQKSSYELSLNEFQIGLTKQDSLIVVQKCDSCMEFLKSGNIDEALSMLYEYDDSLHQVLPLSNVNRENYLRKFNMFPVLEYCMEYFSFSEEGLNDVKYEVVFGPKALGSPKTFYMFNPIKINGHWYLSVKSSMQSIDESMR